MPLSSPRAMRQIESGKEIDCLVRLEEGHPFQAVAAGGNLNTENRNVTLVKFEIVKGEHNDEDNVGSNFTQYIAWHKKITVHWMILNRDICQQTIFIDRKVFARAQIWTLAFCFTLL